MFRLASDASVKALSTGLHDGYTARVKNDAHGPAVERLFPFVLRSGILLIGRDALRRRKGKLHFVLITTDVSTKSKEEILKDFAHYPVVQYYEADDLERLFRIRGAKVIGFAKSGLAQSVYAELKSHRINQPVMRRQAPGSPSPAPGGQEPDGVSPSRREA